MAFHRAQAINSRTFLIGASVLAGCGITYYATRKPILLDSPQNAPTKTLSFPSTMLFSKQLTVTNVEQVNHDTKKITFALPGGDGEISGVTPGAAILTQHSSEKKWFPVLRPYTPIHQLDEPGILQLLVKKYPNGVASTHMHSLEPGQKLTVRGPIPGASYTPCTSQQQQQQQPRHLLFIAGGAGITPIYSLAKGILNNEADKSHIQLVWGVNGIRDLVLKSELESLEKKFPDRLQVTYVVSGPEGKPDAPSLGDATKFKKGYVNESVLREAIARCEGKEGWAGDAKGVKVFLCGPPKMEDAIAGRKGVLGELGVQKKEVHRF